MNEAIRIELEDGTVTPVAKAPVNVPKSKQAPLSLNNRIDRENEATAATAVKLAKKAQRREHVRLSTEPSVKWREFCGSYQLVDTRPQPFDLVKIHLQTDELAVLFSPDGYVMGSGTKEGMAEKLLAQAEFNLSLWCPAEPWTEEQLKLLNESRVNTTSTALFRHVRSLLKGE